MNATYVGRLGQDPEQKDFGTSKLTTFTLGCDTGSGQQKSTSWGKCKIWGKLGDVAVQYLAKGSQVVVAGNQSYTSYQKPDGTKGTSLELDVKELRMVGPKKEETQNNSAENCEIPF